MISQTDLSGKLAIDAKGMDTLRETAKQNSPEALKTAATQFEALFLNMVMKSMRDATPQDGPLDSEQGRMFTSMFDQQVSQNLAKKGVGLADVLIRQLSKTTVHPPSANGDATAPLINASPIAANAEKGQFESRRADAADPMSRMALLKSMATQPVADSSMNAVTPTGKSGRHRPHVEAFTDRVAAHADEASRETGIPAKFMIGQAALESGWGRREIVGKDGAASHNLFGLKATGNWKGKVVEATTTEYVNGVAQRKVEKFRAYDNYADAFRDYAKMLRDNPRYANVMASATDAKGFAQGLQRAGYATDPHYAAKLNRIISQTLSA